MEEEEKKRKMRHINNTLTAEHHKPFFILLLVLITNIPRITSTRRPENRRAGGLEGGNESGKLKWREKAKRWKVRQEWWTSGKDEGDEEIKKKRMKLEERREETRMV
ncbi:hypothetical protein E2C01_080228 [Portunus trituberculatus]|uniref:Uncharacterized protein n=1 Tax=Portunus trituberculatus TaxID=210409 RepID=A0A5B7ILM4_PORTR|nr:hypothetical protein [Portunus trituberculatus]